MTDKTGATSAAKTNEQTTDSQTQTTPLNAEKRDSSPSANAANNPISQTPPAAGAEPDQMTATEESVTGFAPFRLWLNQRLQARPVTLRYAELDHNVAEITNDGRLRLTYGAEARLIPFDSRYIQAILEQTL